MIEFNREAIPYDPRPQWEKVEKAAASGTGSATAALSERIFAEGKSAACLYTDLSNIYSNRCYARGAASGHTAMLGTISGRRKFWPKDESMVSSFATLSPR